MAYALLVINPLQQIIDDVSWNTILRQTDCINVKILFILFQQLSIKESTFLYNLFKKPPLDVFIAITVFNITNAEAFLNGTTTKLHVVEVGPFVYQWVVGWLLNYTDFHFKFQIDSFRREFLEHQNMTFNADGTIGYVPRRSHKFIADRSIGHPSDYRIKVPNIPLLGMSSQMNKWSIFAAMTLSSLAMSLKLQPLLDMTVDEYLWGYDDPLVKFGSQIIPSFINIEKFGLLDRMFDDGLDTVQMHLPDTPISPEDNLHAAIVPRDFSIHGWNNRSGLKQWHYNEDNHLARGNTPCNTLRGTYDGTLFPKGFNQDFRVYRKALCRTLPMKHTHADRESGINVEYFKLDERAFLNDANDPESSCYCEDKKCLKPGLSDISPCYYSELLKCD